MTYGMAYCVGSFMNSPCPRETLVAQATAPHRAPVDHVSVLCSSYLTVAVYGGRTPLLA